MSSFYNEFENDTRKWCLNFVQCIFSWCFYFCYWTFKWMPRNTSINEYLIFELWIFIKIYCIIARIMKHLKQRKREHLFSKENCVDISILWKYEQLLYINRKISIEITNWYVFSAKFSFIIPWKLLLWRRPV